MAIHHAQKSSPSHLSKQHHRYPGSVKVKTHGKHKAKKQGPPPKPPQDLVGQLSIQTLAPGVVHKVHHGPMSINVLDVDLAKANVIVKPVLAGSSFDTLDEVRDQAQKVRAIAAVNGNYFKRDGTPLGTLIIDGEWVAGPLFDRTCMGMTRDGKILVDRVTLHGTLTTSNPEAPSIWVNNINQPRRHGAHLIVYTRRWGDKVAMQYAGSLVAVDYTGKVVATATTVLAIPDGGYVLSDSKDSEIAKLKVGDEARLSWQPGPSEWSDVINAVSGGPVLIRDGKLFVDCKDECFTKAWTGSQIHARTAVGVTADRHLLLATIEGPHTLWDVAKFLKKLGAVDAMNLDGGGSTTMVISGHTVTKNGNKFERRVASSLAILPRSGVNVVQYQGAAQVAPANNAGAPFAVQSFGTSSQVAPPVAPAFMMPQEPAIIQQAPVVQQIPIQRSVPMLPYTQQQTATQPLPDVLAGATAPRRYTNTDAIGGLQHMQSPAVPANSAAPLDSSKRAGRFGWMKHLSPLKSDYLD